MNNHTDFLRKYYIKGSLAIYPIGYTPSGKCIRYYVYHISDLIDKFIELENMTKTNYDDVNNTNSNYVDYKDFLYVSFSDSLHSSMHQISPSLVSSRDTKPFKTQLNSDNKILGLYINSLGITLSVCGCFDKEDLFNYIHNKIQNNKQCDAVSVA